MDIQIMDVMQLVSDALGIPRDFVKEDLAYGDVPEWDSMGHMNVMMELEDRFGVEITTDTIAQLTSIPVITAYLEGRRNE